MAFAGVSNRSRAKGAFAGIRGLIQRPTELPNLAAWYDVSDFSSLRVDSSNRVSLISDKSGNSTVNCLCLNGVAGNYASTPDSAAISPTTELELVFRAALNSWTPASLNQIVAKEQTAATRSFSFGVATTGVLFLRLSGDGFAVSTAQSTVATGFSVFSTAWCKMTWRASDGRTQFFTSTSQGNAEPSDWAQLGTDTTLILAGINDNNSFLELGSRLSGAAEQMAGRIYRVIVRTTIGGVVAFDANFANAAKLATSFTESSSNAATVTINSTGDLGARISGERDLYQGTVSKQPVYLAFSGAKYAYFGGVTGGFRISTPNAVGNQFAGDMDIRVKARLPNWASPSALAYIVTKWTDATNRGWTLFVHTNGFLNAQFSLDGSTILTASATVAFSFANDSDNWVRVTREATSGNVFFYTSSDGVTWTQLGAMRTTSAGVNFNSTNSVVLGGFSASSGQFSGRVYIMELRDGIGGAVTQRFDASEYTSGTSFISSTGETWTLNSGATIVDRTTLYFDGSDDYMKAPAFSLSQPETVYFVGQQVTWTDQDTFFDGNTNETMMAFQRSGTPQVGIRAGTSLGNVSPALATPCVISGVYNSATSAVRLNRGTAITGDASTSSAGGFTLGARGSVGANPANIRTSEIAIFAAAHDTNSIYRMLIYLWRKWRLPFNI